MLHDSSERAARGAQRQESKELCYTTAVSVQREAQSARSHVTKKAECHADGGASRCAPQAWASPLFHTALFRLRGTPADGVLVAWPDDKL